MDPKINHADELTIHDISDCLRDSRILPKCASLTKRGTYRVHPNVFIRSYKVTQTNWRTFTTVVLTPPNALIEINSSNSIISERVITESHTRRHSWFPQTLLPQTTFPAYIHGTDTCYTAGEHALPDSFGYSHGIYSATLESKWLEKAV